MKQRISDKRLAYLSSREYLKNCGLSTIHEMAKDILYFKQKLAKAKGKKK